MVVKTSFDSVNAVLTLVDAGLFPLFYPRSVAVVGATERKGSVGYTVMHNLMEANRNCNFNYTIYPINPTRDSVCGFPCFKQISNVPVSVDMVVVITPAKTVPRLAEEAGKAGAKSMVVISAGFKEVGEEGTELENETVAIAKKHKMRIVGPNCLGVMNPNYGLNATFASHMALPGNLAFVSQSGAMCTAALDWSMKQRIGFSSFVSIGSMADVNWGDLVYFLGEDPKTKAILIYMETIGDARTFLSAAKRVSRTKPIIVLKAGKTEAAAQAAASHTGSLAGSHDAFLAAMKRVGVLTVDQIGDLFDCALLLDKQPRPHGPNLMIITNAGGPGVLSTDATVLNGGVICPIEPELETELDQFLPPAWSHANPIDILGDANGDVYQKTLQCALKAKNADGILVVLSPQSVTEPTKTAEALIKTVEELRESGELPKKPIIASWMGGESVAEGFNLLQSYGIPTFAHPDEAARTFCLIYRQNHEWQQVNEPVQLKISSEKGDSGKTARTILEKAQAEGREVLSENDSKVVLNSYGIPIVETIICETAEAAGKAGDRVAYPCVAKLHSNTITHKSDVGGVVIGIKNRQACEDAFTKIKKNCIDHAGAEHFLGVTVQPMVDITSGIELLLGSTMDAQFGPLVVFGAGGCMVEIFKDTNIGIPPLANNSSKLLVRNTKISKALEGIGNARFPGINMDKLHSCVIQFSRMMCDLVAHVSELEINPLLAQKESVLALDARIVLRKADQLVPQLILRPYPVEYVTTAKLNDAKAVIKPLSSDDYYLTKEFISKISETTICRRFLKEEDQKAMQALTKDALMNFVNADFSNQIGLGCCIEVNNQQELVGVVRIGRFPHNKDIAEIKIVVRDDWQGLGVGRALMAAIEDIVKKEGIVQVEGVAKKESVSALKCMIDVGYTVSDLSQDLIKISKCY